MNDIIDKLTEIIQHNTSVRRDDNGRITNVISNNEETAKKVYEYMRPMLSSEYFISVNDEKPPYGMEVIVCRPNEYSGKVDVILAYLHEALPGGRAYGRPGNGGITYGDWWSFPAVAPFEDVTYWKFKPIAKQ